MSENLSFLIACAIIAAISIPLILRAVPPNPWYGFRTKATLADRELWYRANYFAGWAFLAAALVSAALFIGVAIAPAYRALALVVPVGLALAVSGAYTRNVQRRKGET